MQTRLLLGSLPCYAAAKADFENGICFAGFRAAQISDDDIPAATLGSKQASAARAFAAPGDGLSMLFASGKGDIVLVRAAPDPDEQTTLARRAQRLSEHLGRCGFETGSVVFVPEIESALADHGGDRFICPATFGTAMLRAIANDAEAESHRQVVRALMNKVDGYQILKGAGVDGLLLRSIYDIQNVDDFLENSRGPWALKSPYGTGGQGFAIEDTRSQFLSTWSRIASDWGGVFAAECGEGPLVVASLVVDPDRPEPGAGLFCEMAVEMGRPKGLRWRDGAAFEPALAEGAAAIASVHRRYAMSMGGSLFAETQDWGTRPPSFLGAAPRIGSATALSVYIARAPKRPACLRSLVLPVEAGSDGALFDKLRDIEVTPERGQGLLVYSVGDHPRPHALALAVDDEGADLENALRRLL